MLINLNKKDLISLVRGTDPCYNVFDNELVKKSGRFIGQGWQWTDLDNLSEEELYSLYKICSESWYII